MVPRKKNYRKLSLADKLKLIQNVESGKKNKCDIAFEFNIPMSALSTILKSKKKIVAHKVKVKLVENFVKNQTSLSMLRNVY